MAITREQYVRAQKNARIRVGMRRHWLDRAIDEMPGFRVIDNTIGGPYGILGS